MAVEQEGGSGPEAGVHAGGIFGIGLDEHEALPDGAVAFDIGPQFAQEGFFEFQDW